MPGCPTSAARAGPAGIAALGGGSIGRASWRRAERRWRNVVSLTPSSQRSSSRVQPPPARRAVRASAGGKPSGSGTQGTGSGPTAVIRAYASSRWRRRPAVRAAIAPSRRTAPFSHAPCARSTPRTSAASSASCTRSSASCSLRLNRRAVASRCGGTGGEVMVLRRPRQPGTSVSEPGNTNRSRPRPHAGQTASEGPGAPLAPPPPRAVHNRLGPRRVRSGLVAQGTASPPPLHHAGDHHRITAAPRQPPERRRRHRRAVIGAGGSAGGGRSGRAPRAGVRPGPRALAVRTPPRRPPPLCVSPGRCSGCSRWLRSPAT